MATLEYILSSLEKNRKNTDKAFAARWVWLVSHGSNANVATLKMWDSGKFRKCSIVIHGVDTFSGSALLESHSGKQPGSESVLRACKQIKSFMSKDSYREKVVSDSHGCEIPSWVQAFIDSYSFESTGKAETAFDAMSKAGLKLFSVI